MIGRTRRRLVYILCAKKEREEGKQTEPATAASMHPVEGRENGSHGSLVPNIAFALSNWEGGTRYHPKRREDEENNEQKTRAEESPSGLEDGTMAEFTMTFSIQDLFDDKMAYDAAYEGVSLASGVSEQSGGNPSRPTSPAV